MSLLDHQIARQNIGLRSNSSFQFTIKWPLTLFASKVELEIKGTRTAAGKDYIAINIPPFDGKHLHCQNSLNHACMYRFLSA